MPKGSNYALVHEYKPFEIYKWGVFKFRITVINVQMTC